MRTGQLTTGHHASYVFTWRCSRYDSVGATTITTWPDWPGDGPRSPGGDCDDVIVEYVHDL